MAAYAAVVSLMHLMEQIQLYHARRPIFHDKQQRQLESLHKKVSFLQDFLESYSHEGRSDKVECLESRILDAAYVAEDIIESYVVDDIHGRSQQKQRRNKKLDVNPCRSRIQMKRNRTMFSQDIQHVTTHVDSIRREVMESKDQISVPKHPWPQELEPVRPSKLFTTRNDDVVGFDDILNPIMDKLIGKQANLDIIAITGMGGIGKTTLAKKVYDNQITVEHFDTLGWVTVSQQFNVQEILFSLLCKINVLSGEEKLEYHQLGEKLYKHLCGRRYLITLDDIWSLEAWYRIKLFLPDNNDGSRVILTTRLSSVADNIGCCHIHKMNFLDENESWSLLCRRVFVQNSCPPEFEEVGRKIAENCIGLPLSIVALGGLLAKSVKREYWEYIAENTSSIINSDDGDHCLKILYVSYNHLPVHLKPCFLYLGVFPEDQQIRVANIIKLWVAEGFLKPKKSKSLEEVANNYLNELIDRSLVLATSFGSTGNVKFCKIHDLLRDLCLREAKKQRFLYVTKVHNADIASIKSGRRIAIHSGMSHDEYSPQVCRALQSASFLRSFTRNFQSRFRSSSTLKIFKLLRVWNGDNNCVDIGLSELYNLRYLSERGTSLFLSSIHLFWNLQTLIIYGFGIVAPPEIWETPQLRHVMINSVHLGDPCVLEMDGLTNNVVLENLQTLWTVIDFRCTEQVLKKIPNVKKLEVQYQHDEMFPNENILEVQYQHDQMLHSLKNIGHLMKLESLVIGITFNCDKFFQNLELPLSLKKLDLSCCKFDWEELGTKVGSLPHLEKLKLEACDAGEEWNSVDGQFPRLKFLEISGTTLVSWTAESTHFPSLEHLILSRMYELEEIPFEIGDIPTLRSIVVNCCNDSAVASAQRILEEQKSFGNEDLHVEKQKSLSDSDSD